MELFSYITGWVLNRLRMDHFIDEKLFLASCKRLLLNLFYTGLIGVIKNHLSGANVIKLFTTVIYRYSMAILSLCVMKLYYLGHYCGMAVVTTVKSFITLAREGKLKYCGNLRRNFNPRNSKVKITL